MKPKGIYLQYGCGNCAPAEWVNFDASLALRLQKTPVLNWFMKKTWPSNVRYGDILRKLRGIEENSCEAVYCSHTLEHLCLEDFRLALKNTFRLVKPGGTFRLVIPNLEPMARSYIQELEKGNPLGSIRFMEISWLGLRKRERGLKAMIRNHYSFDQHLWMWDKCSMKEELKNCGFIEIRECKFGDSPDPLFKLVESEERYMTSFGMEGIKPV